MAVFSMSWTAWGIRLIGGLARVTETTAGGSVYTFRLSVGRGEGVVVSRCWAAPARDHVLQSAASAATRVRRTSDVTSSPRPAEHPVPADPQRVGRDAQIDDERLAHDVRPPQEAPEAAVVGLVAVVAHHEEMPRRHDHGTPRVRRGAVMGGIGTDVVLQLPRADLLQPEIRIRLAPAGEMQRVRLGQPLPGAGQRVVHPPPNVP